MSIIADCLEAGIKTAIERLPDFIRWVLKMFRSKREDVEVSKRDEREAQRQAALNELEISKRLAQRDILGITEAELIGQSEIAAEDVREALRDLNRAGRAFYQNGKWFSRDPVVEVRRFASRWSAEPET